MNQSRRDRIRSVVRKEFRHIFRDRVSCLLLFLMPDGKYLVVQG